MRVIVGRIGRAHGIRGDVMVGVRTDEPELRFAVGSRLDTDPAATGPLTVATRRWQSGELVVRFQGIKDRTAAEALRGTWLTVDTATLAPLEDPDEFRDHDLVGLTARTPDGTEIGEVTDVRHHGQDLLVIKPAGDASAPAATPSTVGSSGAPPASPSTEARVTSGAAGAEILVPFVKAIVPDIDLAAGTLVIDPPPGLLDPDEAG